MTGIDDTSKFDPIEHILGAAMNPRYVEDMEAQGQRQMVASVSLPIRTQRGDEERAEIEAMGVVFGDPVDDLFQGVTLPDGWELKATDHDMWSEVVDQDGVERIAVFYKAAFYDRSAFMRVTRKSQGDTA